MKRSRKQPKRKTKSLTYSFPPRTGLEVAGFLYDSHRDSAKQIIYEIARRFSLDVEIHS